MSVHPPFRAVTFEVDRLIRVVDGDLELLRELKALFLEDSEKTLSDTLEALAREDGNGIWRGAHSLKGAVGNFAAPEAFELTARLERESKAGDFEAARATYDEIVSALDQLMTELDDFLHEMA